MADAIRAVAGVRLLDYLVRSVAQPIGLHASPATPPASSSAVLALFERAVADIDLRTHRGEHPRLGAVDVVPFVPIEGVTMAECVALARKVGAAVAERFQRPGVSLRGGVDAIRARKNLEDIRRGEFEGLAAKMATAGWAPDFGPAAPHPTRRRQRSSARACRSSPTTSTSRPIGSTSRRRLPRRSGTAAAASAS